MVDHYHGEASLFALCNSLRIRSLSGPKGPQSALLQDMLQGLCETAGQTVPLPSYQDQSLVQLPPKPQVKMAVQYFLDHLDCTTDIFTPENLTVNLDHVYSQPPGPGKDIWISCFKTILLLVLGMEISSQKGNALFGDFARSLLPSRAELLSSRLLTATQLINVQTLILLVRRCC